MNRYKYAAGPAGELPWFLFFTHRPEIEVVNGYIELEDWDELANMTALYRGFELVTEDNPDPELFSTDIEATLEKVRANDKARKEAAQAEPQVVSTNNLLNELETVTEKPSRKRK